MTDLLQKKSNEFYKLMNKVIDDVKLSDYDQEVDNFDKFNNFERQLRKILDFNKSQLHYTKGDDIEELEESDENEIQKFNTQVDSTIDEFIISTGSQKLLQSMIQQYVEDNGENKSTFHQKISTVLDFIIWLNLNLELPYRTSFYQSLIFISTQILLISTEEIESFWTYIESRLKIIKYKLFSGSINERMYILQLGNSLTDYFETSRFGDKTKPIKKDTINDRIQSRIRTFMTNLLEFEDSTGRNKFFHMGNSIAPRIPTKDKFLSDIMDIQKVFNDPVFYMRRENYKEFLAMTDKITAVLGELLKEYKEYRMKKIEPDQFNRKPTISITEANYLKKKFSKKLFVPSSYIGANEDKKKEDIDFLFDQLESPIVKLQYIAQIFMVGGLYSEASNASKTDLLKSIGAPPNARHLTEENINATLAKKYFELKKEIQNGLRKCDPQTMFLFQTLHFGERSWWALLLKGKDSDIQNVFANKLITPEELISTEDKFLKLYPYKNKKSFNTYITPQVSKKMRKSRGLENLKESVVFNVENAEEDNKLINEKLIDEDTMEDKSELKEKKSSNLWKMLRKRRYELVE
ncbi:hypothetical protein KGF54_001346 [Candida jiufengensis]|uniref:uncharacterized protein n=1 Tax=Candida jiufengensis TaxID=497108 RepID=UPI0022255BEC|nr:uncharacterized protein KGF54_001346 [Candida jiufengensis]KAI5955844.1 hypothetical protein KGF54_001346 [Candida jiufengensis]